jgi:anti-anti-sigma regulatory factor
LIVLNGKLKGRQVPIKGDLFLMGSERMCQLRSNHPDIAPQHCAITTREKRVFVQDMGSGMATVVNGEVMPPGQSWPLHDGDRITIGPLEFRVDFLESHLAERDAEEWALKTLDQANKPTEESLLDEDIPRADQHFDTPASAAAAILDRLQSMRGIVKGRLRVALDSGITIIRFNDNQLIDDAEITLIKRELFANLAQGSLRVLLDCKNIERMSTVATEMLLELQRQLRARGSALAICRIRPPLQPLFEALRIPQQIPTFKNKAEAMNGRW